MNLTAQENTANNNTVTNESANNKTAHNNNKEGDLQIARLSTQQVDFDQQLDTLLAWDVGDNSDVAEVVADVLADVRTRGDEAILAYTQKFDGLDINSAEDLRISSADMQRAAERIGSEQLHALQAAAQRIRDYHEHQIEQSWSFEDSLGNRLGQKITPLQRVGVYVPGGQASYPSSVLMTLIPAAVAGVDEIVVTVPTPKGARNDMVLAALHIAGASEVITIGGAQAIGGLAYGTQTIGKVDKIVGPGGAYVAEAKRQVYGHVGIDIIAGPSEILIIADGTTNPEWVAMDLFSQAEHDAAAQSILLSPDAEFIEEVLAQMERILPTMSRQQIIRDSLANRGALVVTESVDQAVDISNRIAPEHLELQVANAEHWLDHIRHAGAIFCGPYSGETLGDYVAGPSHVLPTFGTARFGSPLGVYDFVKRSSVIQISAVGAMALADVAVPLASSEGLEAHARAAALRAQQKN